MKIIFIFSLIMLLGIAVYAQELTKVDLLPEPMLYNRSNNLNINAQGNSFYSEPKMNLIKINLTGLPIRNYSIQYERVLNKMLSVSISYRNMPEGKLPFKTQILKSIDDSDTEAKNIINNFTLSNYAITPEIRFYLGKKGYGQGFYIAPFFRIASYKGNNFDVEYEDETNNNQTISLSGDIKSNTIGVLFGAQWSLSKLIVLDWWILGPHIGSGKGDLAGLSSRTLSSTEQANINQTLEDFDIPFFDKEIIVNSQGATMKLDGLFGGIRAGISFGVKF